MKFQIPDRFHSLDLIRGIAALSVVFWHWQHFFYNGTVAGPYELQAQPFYSVFFVLYETGWLAVDFFFSLSGFIFFFLYADAIGAQKVKAWPFFVLRFSRLYPLHLATLVLVAVLQQWVFARTGDYFVIPFNDAYHFVLNLFLASSWGLEHGYSFNGPIWSVSVEVLMYVMFFVMCWLFNRRLAATVALVAIGLVLFSAFPILGRGVFSFFFGGLTLLFYRHLCHRDWVSPALKIAATVTVLLWLGTVLEVASPWFWPGVSNALNAVLPEHLHSLVDKIVHAASRFSIVALLFPMTILSLALAETRRGHLGRRFGLIGSVSYSSYLLHFPLQLVMFMSVIQWGGSAAFFYQPVSMLLFFAILIPLCLLSYRYFEAPAQKAVRKLLLGSARRPNTAPAS